MLLATALPSGFANHHLPSRTLIRKQQTGPKVPRAFHQLLMERKQLCDTQIRGVAVPMFGADRLEFIQPLMPTLVKTPPEGNGW